MSNKIQEQTLNPFSYVKHSTGTTLITIMSLLLVQVFMLIVTKSFRSIFIVISAVAASVCAELLFYKVKKQFKYNWIESLIQGLLLGLLIPAGYPVIAVFIIGFIVFISARFAFNGFAGSWFNPIAVTVIILYFINSQIFPEFILTNDDVQTKNAALTLIQNGTVNIISADAPITAFLNRTVFNLFGIVIPEGYVSFLWDSGSVIPAFRFNFVTLISSIILFSVDVTDIMIPAVFTVLYALLVKFLSPVFTGGTPIQGDIILCLLSSGTLFSALYLLQWHGTLPQSGAGKLLYAVLAAISAFAIMGPGTSSCGFMFVILIMNFITPVILYFELKIADYKMNTVLLKKINS